jgi:hypothetical protein
MEEKRRLESYKNAKAEKRHEEDEREKAEAAKDKLRDS